MNNDSIKCKRNTIIQQTNMTSKITYSRKPNCKAVIIKSINKDTLKLQHCL